MRWFILVALAVLAACSPSVDPSLDPELHGQEVADDTNLPEQEDGLEIETTAVNYYADVEGYLARPVAEGQYPGVVMIHEWWGLNDNIRMMAERLAAQGYLVLAVDLYNGTVADEPSEAQQLVQSFSQEEGTRNMLAARDYLRSEGATRLGSLGWCFGGGQSLELSLADGLDATVIYYGQLVTDPQELRSIDGPVLGIFGAEDSSIPVDTVQEFEDSLNALGVQNSVHVYEGAGHAFANPSGDRYKPEAAQDAWDRTTAFLAENLR